jgi:hypothetical protein
LSENKRVFTDSEKLGNVDIANQDDFHIFAVLLLKRL